MRITTDACTPRHIRADARRNIDGLIRSAAAVFASSGVDAPVRQIALHAGVGVGTLYRHFPQRADLIAAVFRREVDACVQAAKSFGNEQKPYAALERWMQRYSEFIATKRGLAQALHSGDPTFDTLPGYFHSRLQPALQVLLDDAVEAGEIRDDVGAEDLLGAVASLSMSTNENRPDQAQRMVALLVAGLRYQTHSS